MKQEPSLLLMPESKSSANRHALFVSLYLVLLAFFILLHSISQQDENRAEAALSSLQSIFSSEEGRRVIINRPEASLLSEHAIITNFFSGIQKIAQNAVELVEVQTDVNTRRMRLKMHKYDLFNYGETDIKPEKYSFIRDMADILSQNLGVFRVELSVTLTSRQYLDDVKTDLSRLDTLRLGYIARVLEKRDVPIQNIQIAMNEEKTELVILDFAMRNVETSRFNIMPEEEELHQ